MSAMQTSMTSKRTKRLKLQRTLANRMNQAISIEDESCTPVEAMTTEALLTKQAMRYLEKDIIRSNVNFLCKAYSMYL
jgi:hypothetical protein